MKAIQMMRLLPIFLLVVGCASTVQSRIEDNPSVFDSFPSDIQGNVRKGEVDVGYTKPMVEIALGRPDRVYTRKTEDGMNEVWVYVDRRPRSRMSFGFGIGIGTHVGSSGEVFHRHHHPMFMDNDNEEVEKLRIEWDQAHLVKAVEKIR